MSPRIISRGAGRRSHAAGSSGLRQASRSFISSSSFRSHLTAASTRSRSVGAAGQIKEFDSRTSLATSLRLIIGLPLFQVERRAMCQNLLNRSFFSDRLLAPTCTHFAHKQGAVRCPSGRHTGPNQPAGPNGIGRLKVRRPSWRNRIGNAPTVRVYKGANGN
jgi:hypothetical protein